MEVVTRTLQQVQEELAKVIYEAGAFALDIEQHQRELLKRKELADKLRTEAEDLRKKIKSEIDEITKNGKI